MQNPGPGAGSREYGSWVMPAAKTITGDYLLQMSDKSQKIIFSFIFFPILHGEYTVILRFDQKYFYAKIFEWFEFSHIFS